MGTRYNDLLQHWHWYWVNNSIKKLVANGHKLILLPREGCYSYIQDGSIDKMAKGCH
jgi:hypothetical protein